MNRVVTTVGCIVVSVVLTACGSDDQPDLNQNTLETVQSSRQDAYGLMDGRITWLFANGSTSLSLWYVDASLLSKQSYSFVQNKTRKYVRLLIGDAISEPTMYTHLELPAVAEGFTAA